ncbi:MAG: HEAT repeat domain-containing protein [Oligoflexus sp.]
MGLLDKYRNYQETRRKRRIEKAVKLVKNAKAIREDRWGALSFLAEDLDVAADAVPALLPRFEYSLEHGINDTREKELTLKGIVRFGDEALPFLKDWLRSTTRIAWPIKAIKEIGSEEVVVDTLKQALNFNDVTFDQSAVDKNYDILCHLRDYPLDGYFKEIAHFLQDPDERVRFAAAEALIEQNSDEVKVYLQDFLKDDSSENRRIKQAVVSAFLKHSWQVDTQSEFPEGRVMDGVYINAQGQLEVRA